MDEKEQLKLMLKKYLEVKVEIDNKFSGYSDISVIITFDGDVVSTDKSFVTNIG